MAIKKSQLYSALWDSCNKLRGGMDASQYKDYVLTMLFVKYVSDKYAGNPNGLIEVPAGASFADMVALKGQKDIGDKINKQILAPLFEANGLADSMSLVDFNDDQKLGSDKEKVERLGKLIAIFENPALNFKNNRAEDDDILGDAYEFLMRHFATESGKSKGQFYTPAEVSRILAKVIDVHTADRPSFTAYDPTCGSGSLLLKVVEESPNGLTIYGQEKDVATKSLAIMNMWLHGYPEAAIVGGNTLSSPQFKEPNGKLKRFDFVVANPPFSDAEWGTGIVPKDDEYNRFQEYGVPPDKNGDYAYLLHVSASLKSTGKGAVILPHGVLFRGGAEATIRQNLIERKWIKGIIGLPANLFYGTGIPACIIVIDKEHTEQREGVFFVDASKGYVKDGPKNRLREQDLHKIVDVFNSQKEVAKYARLVPFSEIEKNEYNLNIPRYIDSQEEEDIQDLNGHLNGGIPNSDISALQNYWQVYPTLQQQLFEPLRDGYSQVRVETTAIKQTILSHPEFAGYNALLNQVFDTWQAQVKPTLTSIGPDTAPKALIKEVAEALLAAYTDKALVDRYDIYQHLLTYWNETMKDDVYLVVEDGWVAKTRRILVYNEKKKKEEDKGWTCDLVPKEILVAAYFATEQAAIDQLNGELDATKAEIEQLIEEHTSEDAPLADATTDTGSVTKASLAKFMKTLSEDEEAYEIAGKLMELYENEAKAKKELKTLETELEEALLNKYPTLTVDEVKTLVVDHKWLGTIKADIQTEVDAISQRLTTRVKELAERYAEKLGAIDTTTTKLEAKVTAHLQKMGLVWN